MIIDSIGNTRTSSDKPKNNRNTTEDTNNLKKKYAKQRVQTNKWRSMCDFTKRRVGTPIHTQHPRHGY